MSELAHEVVPFGKYKGQPLSVLQYDKQYCEWLSSQDWFRERFSSINTLIINNFAKPEDTPEHNALQSKFLDKEFSTSFVNAVMKQDISARIRKEIDVKTQQDYAIIYERCKQNYKENHRTYYTYSGLAVDGIICPEGMGTCIYGERQAVNSPSEECLCFECSMDPQTGQLEVDHVEFEHYGWDVVVHSSYHNIINSELKFYVEVKPTIGDDFPSVLRQIKSRNYNSYCELPVLVYDGFSASCVSESQISQMFNLSGICVVTAKQILDNKVTLKGVMQQ